MNKSCLLAVSTLLFAGLSVAPAAITEPAPLPPPVAPPKAPPVETKPVEPKVPAADPKAPVADPKAPAAEQKAPAAIDPKAPPAPEVKIPAGADLALSSEDAAFGYNREKPIKIGAATKYGGPAAERAYLGALRDEAGKPVAFERDGSVGVGPDGNVLDRYTVKTSTGRTFALFIDMYHPKNEPAKQLAPKGLFKMGEPAKPAVPKAPVPAK